MARGFSTLTFISGKSFNLYAKMWVVISGLQHSMHAARARVSKHEAWHGTNIVLAKSWSWLSQLCVVVVTRGSISNYFFVIKYFIEYWSENFCCHLTNLSVLSCLVNIHWESVYFYRGLEWAVNVRNIQWEVGHWQSSFNWQYNLWEQTLVCLSKEKMPQGNGAKKDCWKWCCEWI